MHSLNVKDKVSIVNLDDADEPYLGEVVDITPVFARDLAKIVTVGMLVDTSFPAPGEECVLVEAEGTMGYVAVGRLTKLEKIEPHDLNPKLSAFNREMIALKEKYYDKRGELKNRMNDPGVNSYQWHRYDSGVELMDFCIAELESILKAADEHLFNEKDGE